MLTRQLREALRDGGLGFWDICPRAAGRDLLQVFALRRARSAQICVHALSTPLACCMPFAVLALCAFPRDRAHAACRVGQLTLQL